MKIKRQYFYFARLISALILAVSLDIPVTATTATAGKQGKTQIKQSAGSKTADNLRGVYYTPAQDGPATSVGRLAILLLAGPDNGQEVNLHHRFHTGDSFRFMVSSNHDGWLYILHRSPRGQPQLLWPRVNPDAAESHLDYNRVQAGEDIMVPARPGKFTFDDEIGNEYFYIVIRQERLPPGLSAIDTVVNPESDAPSEKAEPVKEIVTAPEKNPASAQPAASVSDQKIVQFSIRGGNHPIRGVVFDPGPKDADPHTYFSSHPDDGLADVILEFKLHHEQ